jgi:hypothetical protein
MAARNVQVPPDVAHTLSPTFSSGKSPVELTGNSTMKSTAEVGCDLDNISADPTSPACYSKRAEAPTL